jgi:hypothetical protein
MQPNSDINITELAKWAPRIAYGLVVGVPRVPVVLEIPIQFTTSAVDAPPIVASFDNNLTQDTMIERIAFTLFQQNSFPGSPFQSLYFAQLKAQTGVGVQLQVFGGPKYVVSDTFVELATLADVLAITWPQGWPLFKQSNVKVSAILTQTPVSVPFDVKITFLGWQMLDKSIDDISDNEARERLRTMGLQVPDVTALLQPSK